MASDSPDHEPESKPTNLNEIWKAYLAEHPNAGLPEWFILLLNYTGPSEPKFVQEADEPSLETDSTEDYEAYRFSCIGPCWGVNWLVRIENVQGEYKLVVKLHAPTKNRWQTQSEANCSKSDFDTVISLLDRAEFWQTPFMAKEQMGFDYPEMMIAGRKRNRYHAVQRYREFSKGLSDAYAYVHDLAKLNEHIE